ncbi:MAG: c-type cytochrome [Acidobacteria bacterium]|nr:c-type cytochrome [Acidobacteriota bacterium]
MQRPALFVYLCCASTLFAQRDPQAEQRYENLKQPEMIDAGGKLYGGACSACHGQTGEGGRGPNLADGRAIRRLRPDQIFNSIRQSVPGTDMPAFRLPDGKVWQLVAYVRSLSAPAHESRAPGDPEAGRALFFGKAGCSGCHMIRGNGGFLGPDLSHAGMQRSLKYLREALLDPSARLADGFQGVEVKTRAGETIGGVAKNYDNYSIQVLDRAGRLHLLRKSDLAEIALSRRSLMPGDYRTRLSAADADNILAYLSRQAMRTGTPFTRSRR